MALNKTRLQRQLVRSQAHRFLCNVRRNAFHLKQDLAGANNCHPVIERSLAGTHSDFGRLLGDWLVREEPDPDLAATLDKTRHRNTAGLDLEVRNVAALHD